MRDYGGRDIPLDIEPAFRKAKSMRLWKAKLSGSMQGLLAIDRMNDMEVGIDLKEAHEVLRAIITRIDDSIPFSVCMKCHGKDALCECKGKGWLSRSQIVQCRLRKPRKPHTSVRDTSPTESGEESCE
jgi:hypothetical protein